MAGGFLLALISGLFNDAGEAKFDLPAMLRRGNFLNASSMVIRAAVRDEILAIETPFIDYRVHLRAARRGLLAQLGQALAVYRINSSGSMLSRANDRVRQCYWEAILDVPRDRVTDADFARGIADFLRRVIFRSVRARRWSLLREWAPRVYAVSPYGEMRTSWFVARAFLRAVAVEVAGRLGLLAGGRRVLHRR